MMQKYMVETNEVLKEVKKKLDRKFEKNSSEDKDNKFGVETKKVEKNDYEENKNKNETEVELEVRVDAIRESMDETNEMLK